MEAGGEYFIIYPNPEDWIELWDFSDLHIGNAGTAVDKLKRDIDAVYNNPNAFWFGGGDYAEFISPRNDKRFQPSSVSKDLKVFELASLGMALETRVRDLFFQIKEKGLGLLIGNHESKYMNDKEQDNLHNWLCTELGLINFGYSALFKLTFINDPKIKEPKLFKEKPTLKGEHHTKSFTIFAHHGAGYSQSAGGKINRIKKFMDGFDADIYFCSHVHDQCAKRYPAIKLGDGSRTILSRDRLGVISGSYLKTYEQGITTYGEIKGYDPSPLGAVCVEFHPNSGEVKAAI